MPGARDRRRRRCIVRRRGLAERRTDDHGSGRV